MIPFKGTAQRARFSGKARMILFVVWSFFIFASQYATAETFHFYTPPKAAAPAEYPGVFCEAELSLTALSDKTRYHIYDLKNLAAGSIASGHLDRHKLHTISASEIPPGGYYRLITSDMVLAHLGQDCLGQGIGGSFFFPTSDGRSFIGTEHVINIPVLGPNNEFIVFAYQSASVTIKDTKGKIVDSGQIAENSYWKPTKLVSGNTYIVLSTGHIALQSNSLDGYTTVPGQHTTNMTSCYNNAATNFLFATWDGSTNNQLLFTAYENAQLTLWNLDEPKDPGLSFNLKKGDVLPIALQGNLPRHWRLESTNAGRVLIQTGLKEHADSVSYEGDDIDFHSGFDGAHFIFPSMNQGSHIFMNSDHTDISAFSLLSGTKSHTLNHLDTLAFSPLTNWIVQSNHPILMETVGGTVVQENNELNDFGTFILPLFHVDANANTIFDHLEDLDLDGNPNACDLDNDGDGIPDKLDRCPNTPVRPEDDLDRDGCPDNPPNADLDGDGIPNDQDACPDIPGPASNNGCPGTDWDLDGDGIANEIDNCPEVYNPDQADSNNNGIGDACEEGNPGIGATGGGAVFSCHAAMVGKRGEQLLSVGLFVPWIIGQLLSIDALQALLTMDGGR